VGATRKKKKNADEIGSELCLPRLGTSGRPLTLKIAASAKQASPHHLKFTKVHIGPRFAHGFQPSYVYDFIAKLYGQQAEVIQNHENEHVRSVGQGEGRHRK
jgi:hypothetical protein